MSKVNKLARLVLAMTGPILLLSSSNANAAFKLSDFASGWTSEAKVILTAIMIVLMAVGIVIAMWGIISGIMTKRQDRPMTWQPLAIIGAALLVVVPALIIAVSGSFTNGNGNAESQMTELGIKY